MANTCSGLAAAMLSVGQMVLAEADGPDYFNVTGGKAGDALSVHSEPNASARKLGEIPPDGTCIRNLGCRGGLSFQEYTSLSPAQRDRRLKQNPRCCRVEYKGMAGWAAGRYLVEGECP